MPLGAQPRGARGTVERPYSALRLRRVLAAFGFFVCLVGGVLMVTTGHAAFAVALFLLAVVAAVDLVVVMTRIQRGRVEAAPRWRRPGPDGRK